MDTPPVQDPNSEPNPYVVCDVRESDAVSGVRQPGPIAIIFAVILGLAIAGGTFVLTFFFTCLGAVSINVTEAAVLPLVIIISTATAGAAGFFTAWGLLKTVKAIKNSNR